MKSSSILLGFPLLAALACSDSPVDLPEPDGEELSKEVVALAPPPGAGPPPGTGPPPGKGPGFLSQIAFSSDRDGDPEIFVMRLDGSNPTQLTDNSASDIDPTWSPDGTQIAFASDLRSGQIEVWVMNADGSGLTGLDPTGLLCKLAAPVGEEPAWSPDGSEIAFAKTCSDIGDFDIFSVAADGTTSGRLARAAGIDTGPTWSPAGTRIAFTTDRSGPSEIWVMDADGGNQSFLGPTFGIGCRVAPQAKDPAWSPDGTRLAFASDCDGDYDIYIMDADGSNPVQLTNSAGLDSEPAWSPDGTRLAFVSDRDGDEDVWVMNVDGSSQTNLTAGSTASDRSPSWQP